MFGIFPVPVMRSTGVLAPRLVADLIAHFSERADQGNNTSPRLSHTRVLRPADSPLFVEVAATITPRIVAFGEQLFGERMGWSLKEMWVNFLDTGGHQAMHNHANSFISGVLYLTRCDPESTTVLMRSPGGSEFRMKNDHPGVVQGPYNADKWVSPAPTPGDMLLFPSYVLHAVPPNPAERRITLAFNAIPLRLDSWGYVLQFSG